MTEPQSRVKGGPISRWGEKRRDEGSEIIFWGDEGPGTFVNFK